MGKQTRKEGYMKPLKKGNTPHRFIFFDTETTFPTKVNPATKFDFILGVMTYVELDKENKIIARKVYRLNKPLDFVGTLDELTHDERMIYVFAHNIGFDIRVLNLPRVFADLGYESEPPIINEMAFIWKVYTEYGKVTFLDTANLGVRSVEKLGKDLGYPKQTINFDTCTRDELMTYCERDVEILEKFVLSYVDYIASNELGSFRVTLASQSLCAYRTRFMTKKPYIHLNEEALKLEREGYHGGRVECFRIGTFTGEPFYYLDVNSMYPYSMIGNTLPVKLKGYTTDVNPLFLKPRLSRYYVIADVTLETKEPVYPLIKNGKLIFPIGTFRTVLYKEELDYAVRNALIKYIHRCAVYEMDDLFSSYVLHFYGAKEQHTLENNITWRTIDKLFLNSLYGKFGQLNPTREFIKTIDYHDIYRLPCINPDTKNHYQEIGWYGDVYRESKQGETPLSCPAVAGAITCRARMTLWNYITLAGRVNVFYCDTDSLIVNSEGYERLTPYLDETKLGYLKVEDKSTHLEIYGNKDYRFGDKIKVKGVPSKATVLSKGRWEYLQFEGFITWLNNGGKGSPSGYYTVKERKSDYNKGDVDDNGIVTPFVL